MSSKQYELHLKFVSTRPTLLFFVFLRCTLLLSLMLSKTKRGSNCFDAMEIHRTQNAKKKCSSSSTTSNYNEITFSMFSQNLFCIAFQVPSDFGNQIGIRTEYYPFVVYSDKDKAPKTVSLHSCNSI